MRLRAALWTTLLAIALVGCAPSVIQSDAHATSKAPADQWQFPASVGQFKRGEVKYTGSGDTRQVMAVYNVEQPVSIAIAVNVYRFNAAYNTNEVLSGADQFDRDRSALLASHGLNVPLPPATAGSITTAGREHPGLVTKFTFQEPFAGNVTDVDTHVYYFATATGPRSTA